MYVRTCKCTCMVCNHNMYVLSYVCVAVPCVPYTCVCRWKVWRMRSHSQSPTEWKDVPSSLSTLARRAPQGYGGYLCPAGYGVYTYIPLLFTTFSLYASLVLYVPVRMHMHIHYSVSAFHHITPYVRMYICTVIICTACAVLWQSVYGT